MTQFHACKQPAKHGLASQHEWEFFSTITESLPVLFSWAPMPTSSSCILHNCNFISQILVGLFLRLISPTAASWSSSLHSLFQTLSRKNANSKWYNYCTKKPGKILIIWKMRGLKVFVLDFSPFCSSLLFKISICKTFVKPTQLWVHSPEQDCLLSILSSFL